MGGELLHLFVKIPIPFIDKHAASIFQQKKELIFYISKEIRKIQFTLISLAYYTIEVNRIYVFTQVPHDIISILGHILCAKRKLI